MLYSLGERRIELRGSLHYIAPNATVIGAVVLEDEASLWFNVVIRGDDDVITIGARTNVQDAAVLHTDPGVPMTLGAEVSIGHQAMLHGCTIGDGTLVGIKAVVLNHAVIGRDCLIGANTLIPERKVIPDRSLVVGSPGRIVRTITDEEIAGIRANADHYVENARRFLRELRVDPRG
jgi:carbonic anhydrase/acetyltransferase-like protein (isoleucine patch superfamily)